MLFPHWLQPCSASHAVMRPFLIFQLSIFTCNTPLMTCNAMNPFKATRSETAGHFHPIFWLFLTCQMTAACSHISQTKIASPSVLKRHNLFHKDSAKGYHSLTADVCKTPCQGSSWSSLFHQLSLGRFGHTRWSPLP